MSKHIGFISLFRRLLLACARERVGKPNTNESSEFTLTFKTLTNSKYLKLFGLEMSLLYPIKFPFTIEFRFLYTIE